MSGQAPKRKTIRVMIPSVDLDLLGNEAEAEAKAVNESGGDLSQRERLIQDLNMEANLLDARQRVKLRKDALETPQVGAQVQSTADKLTDEVFIPMVKERVMGRGSEESSIAAQSLRVAEAALRGKGAQGSPLADLEQGIGILREVKKLVQEETPKLPEGPPPAVGLQDPFAGLEKGIELVERVRKLYPVSGGGSDEFNSASIEFRKWSKEYESKEKRSDRAFDLAIRKQNQEHDARLVELGIRKETNELFKTALQKIGSAVARGLVGEGGLEVPEGAVQGRRETVEMNCLNPKCGAPLIIPPELQVEGKEIICEKCGSKMKWQENSNA